MICYVNIRIFKRLCFQHCSIGNFLTCRILKRLFLQQRTPCFVHSLFKHCSFNVQWRITKYFKHLFIKQRARNLSNALWTRNRKFFEQIEIYSIYYIIVNSLLTTSKIQKIQSKHTTNVCEVKYSENKRRR